MSYRLYVLSRVPAKVRLTPFLGTSVCDKCAHLDLAEVHAMYAEKLPAPRPISTSSPPVVRAIQPSSERQIDLHALTSRAPMRMRAGVLVTLSLVALAIAFVAHWPIFDRSGLVQFEELLLIAYTSVRIGMCIAVDQPRIVLMIAHMWVYTLFGLVQVVQLSKQDNPFHVYAPDSVMSVQLAIMLVGLVVLDVVARWSRGFAIKAVRPREFSLRKVLAFSWLTLLATPVMLPMFGGVAALFSSRYDVTLAVGGYGGSASGVSSTASTIMQFAEVAPFLCVFALLRLRQAKRFTFAARPDAAIAFAGLLVAVVLFDNPISQPRFWIATMAIAAGLSGRWLRRVGFQVLLVYVYIVFSVVLFPFLDSTRVTAEVAALYPEPTGGVTFSYLNKTDYGTMQDVAATITYVQHNGHTDGKQIAGAVLFFVPRSIWAGKAQNTGALLATDMGFVQNFNLDSPLWAEGYIDFGIAGVVLVLGVFGFFVGRADRAYLAGRTPAALSSVLVPVFAGYELILLRGSLLQAFARIFLVIVIGRLMTSRAGASVGTRGRRLATTRSPSRFGTWLDHPDSYHRLRRPSWLTIVPTRGTDTSADDADDEPPPPPPVESRRRPKPCHDWQEVAHVPKADVAERTEESEEIAPQLSR